MTNKQTAIKMIDSNISRRMASATGMTAELMLKLETQKAKIMAAAEAQPDAFFDEVWNAKSPELSMREVMKKLQPLVG